jgi:shikimate dehydrogenase
MTTVLGIFGDPVAHSKSPAMWNAAIEALRLDARYLPFHVRRGSVAEALVGMRALGIRGVNVTLPHKEDVIAHLDHVDEAARFIGAVNTVRLEEGRLEGFNTDAPGLVRSLVEGKAKVSGARALVLGAGGAARAAIVGVAREGASEVRVAARRFEAAEALARSLAPALPCPLVACGFDALDAAFDETDLLIQATSATLAGSPHAASFAASLPIARLPDHATVTDLVYAPLETTVLHAASARGLRTVDGLGMLLHQGAIAFELFLGVTPPLEVMRSALGFAPSGG